MDDSKDYKEDLLAAIKDEENQTRKGSFSRANRHKSMDHSKSIVEGREKKKLSLKQLTQRAADKKGLRMLSINPTTNVKDSMLEISEDQFDVIERK